jgi:hypothetical protein
VAAWLLMGSMAAAQDAAATESRRPALLIPLYAGNAALHGLDLLSTRLALRDGGREANPLLKRASVETVTAVKVGASALTILAAERLWKRNRVAAVGLMIVADVGLSAVVANNYQVRRRPRPGY